MCAIRVVSAALLGAGALTFCAPAVASAVDGDATPFDFSVRPSTIPADGSVTLWVDRSEGGCKGPATVSSPVFDPVTIPPRRSSASAVVDWDATPGAVYKVMFICDGVSGTTSLTVAGGRPVPPHHHDHKHWRKGVQAGEGGSLAGFDLKEIGLGAALIAGSVGTAYYLFRRPGEDGTGS